MSNALPVYVVHWNAPDWARSTTGSILDSTIATRVTVVDNGPYDRPLVLDERVRVVRSGGNLGYAGGANLGIADWLAGDADLCVIVCHDVTLEPDALERLTAAAAEHREYGVLAPDPFENIVSGPVLARGPAARRSRGRAARAFSCAGSASSASAASTRSSGATARTSTSATVCGTRGGRSRSSRAWAPAARARSTPDSERRCT